MNLDRESAAARGLRRYVGLVADALGIGAEASAVQLDDPVNVYLPLERCAGEYPEHDLALLWDERYGWMLAIEVPGTVELTVLGYLADRLLPAPLVVAGYVTRACSGGGFGEPRPQPTADDDDLADRLAGYAEYRIVPLGNQMTQAFSKRRQTQWHASPTSSVSSTDGSMPA